MRDARAMFREALRLYVTHNRALLGAGALLLLPVGIMQVLAKVIEPGTAVMPWSADWTRTASSVAVGVIDFFALLATYAVLTLLIADRLSGGSLGWREGWTRLLARARAVLTGELASLLPTLGWLLALAVPFGLSAVMIQAVWFEATPTPWLVALAGGAAIWLACALMAFVTPVTVMEQKGGFDAVRRNAQLRAERWRFTAAVLLPVTAVRHGTEAALVWIFSGGPIASGVHMLVSWLLAPLEVACVVLLYIAARTRTEAYTNEQLRAEVDAPPLLR